MDLAVIPALAAIVVCIVVYAIDHRPVPPQSAHRPSAGTPASIREDDIRSSLEADRW